ncbi:hypothetical protein U14_02815 [Candidatus Moduliflexus flocculans]|uniref:YkgJ family cysteine cluster protein n=1 Tax=Candidatus Moduliflexus flocculans TaxID=1499966 RepID=A0A081BMF4_9BACT|nr:hypothetical protein U14_02815 [Candidatus Moduliflexus flocculans]
MVTNESNQPIITVFERYATLAAYCDQWFANVVGEYQTQMRCAQGCALCCRLETVVPLEAALIAAYVEALPPQHAVKDDFSADECVFLASDATCAIYPVRPLICRTHGMPLQYPDREERDACPLNFSDIPLEQIAPQYVLSIEPVTVNLLRLNLALCMSAGNADAAGERIYLRDILVRANPLPSHILHVIESNRRLFQHVLKAFV